MRTRANITSNRNAPRFAYLPHRNAATRSEIACRASIGLTTKQAHMRNKNRLQAKE